MFSLRILLVEDDPFIRMDLAMMLQDMGHSVTDARHAAHALSTLESTSKFDLLVTDVDMPGLMNGLALSFAVCSRIPGCRVLVVSGGAHPSPEEMPPGSVFLSKPIGESDLELAIRTLSSD